MKTVTLKLGNYVLEVDTAKTNLYYSTHQSELICCGCDDCRRYLKAAESVSDELNTFFSSLGLCMTHPGEVYSVNDDGSQYGGWYHICGTLLEKPEGSEWITVEDDFRVSFSSNCDCLPNDFPMPCFQMDIEAQIKLCE